MVAALTLENTVAPFRVMRLDPSDCSNCTNAIDNF